MSREFKVGQLVKLLEGFPFEGKVFKIVADNENSWERKNPFSFGHIKVDDGKDFILLMQQSDGMFSPPTDDKGLHVTKNEIIPL